MFTTGLSLDKNTGIRNGTSPMELNAVPPQTPLVGPTPSVEWSSFLSPNSTMNYNFVETADINTDGNLDIIVGNESGGLSIWTGDGTGNWAVFGVPVGLTDIINDIAVSDFNNDGNMDVVVATLMGIKAWIGDGLGGWTVANNGLPPVYSTNSIEMADINLDGDLDIVAGGIGIIFIKGVVVFLGDGNGNWVAGDTGIPNSFTSTGVAVGDFNRDGNLDIASSRDDGISAWIGDGAGSWTLRKNGLPNLGTFTDVKFADFNLDGDLDLIATHSNGGLAVWNGDGWGTWSMTFNLPFFGGYEAVEVGDVNLDGYVDIFTAPIGTNESIWSGDGQDDWFLQTTGLPASISYADIAIGDIDNDGRLDYIGVDSSSNIGIEIWTADVFRIVNSWEVFDPPSTTRNIIDIEIFDVNVDGMMDICLATQNNGIEIWTGDGTGNWLSYTSPTSTGRYRNIRSVDFNNDGYPDLVGTTTGIRAWIGDGAGGWTLRKNGLPNTAPYSGLTIADLNDDGNLDIAAGSKENNGMAVWNGDGWGTWTMTFNLPFTGTYDELDHADVNNDGKLDLLAMNNTIGVFLGDAMDGWTVSSVGLPSIDGSYIDLGFLDMNNDHKPDIVATSITNGAEIWQGNGDGTWSFDSQPLGIKGLGLAVGDFSIDGRMDIVTGSNNTPLGVVPIRQHGIGWANVSSGLPAEGMYSTIELIDINVDGRLDIIANAGGSLGIKIWTAAFVPEPLASPEDPEADLINIANADVVVNWTLSLTDYQVANYLIYRSTAFDVSGAGYAHIDSVESGIFTYTDIGAGEGDNNNYFYMVGAVDASGNFLNATKQAGKITRSLDNGWNLISSPVLRTGTNLGKALCTANWNYALSYDPIQTWNKWGTNGTFKGDEFNDMDTMGNKMGMWLRTNSNDDLITTGIIENVTIDLKAGWNLVGFPSFADKTVAEVKLATGADSIEGFNSTDPYMMEVMGDGDIMTIGNGYWIHVNADTSWIIYNYP